MLLAYLDQRITFYSISDRERLRDVEKETVRLQSEIWSTIQVHANAQPTPTMALTVAGFNDVRSAYRRTQAAWLNRIPIGAWGLLLAVAFSANVLVGLSA